MIRALLALVLALLIIPSNWAVAQSASDTSQAQAADATAGASQVSEGDLVLRERLAKLEGAMEQSDRADERQANLIAFLGIMTTVLAAGITVSIFVLTLKNPRDARRAAREVADAAIKEANDAIKTAKDSIEETRKEFSKVVADSKLKSERANKRMDELEALVATARVKGEEAGKHLTKIEEGVAVAKLLHEMRASQESSREVTEDQKLKLAEAVAESAGKAESEWTIDQFTVAISKALYSDEDYDRAKELSNEMLERFPESDQAKKYALKGLSRAELEADELRASENNSTKLVDLLESMGETESADYCLACHQRAFVRRRLGKYSEAEKELRKVLSLSETVYGENSPNTLITLHELALSVLDQGRGEDAEKLFEDVLSKRRQTFGENARDTLTSQHEYARSILSQGRAADAKTIYQDVLDRTTKELESDSSFVLPIRHELGRATLESGDPALAEEILSKVVEVRLNSIGPEARSTVETRYVLARALLSQGKVDEAIEELNAILEASLEDSDGNEHHYNSAFRSSLAVAQVEAGDISGAAETLAAISETAVNQHFSRGSSAILAYARALVADKIGDRETGDAEIAKSLEIYRDFSSEEHPDRQKVEQYAIERDKSDD